ncbi:MAG: hypothetical protein M1814_006629 [Vezdaea aestivalis]|nr:MAG: hypothetical protein M1814_006629 [Vezdaea aestivalis]
MPAPTVAEAPPLVEGAPKPRKSKSQRKKQNPKSKEKASQSERAPIPSTRNQDEGPESEGDSNRQSDVDTEPAKYQPLNGITSGKPETHTNGLQNKEIISKDSSSADDGGLGKSKEKSKEPNDAMDELRKDMELLRLAHTEELEALNQRVEEIQGEKEEAESQYRSLLEKVGTIKAQLGGRLKADAEALAQASVQIDELESDKRKHGEIIRALETKVAGMTEDNEAKSKELSTLRNRTNLSQQNWIHEREDLVNREAYVREEYEAARQAMQDWEVLAMEERSIRESLTEKLAVLDEELTGQREAFDSAVKERDTQSNTVDGLQRALQEIQSGKLIRVRIQTKQLIALLARKVELRDLVESNQTLVDDLKRQLQEHQLVATRSKTELESVKKDLERALPFESEVKEKNLLIGKLRHEAVTLNDHLTKALRFLKKGKPEDNVDRQIVTNHFLQFLALDRADPKKFQVLQLIAALLNWTDEQREQAGLTRKGAPSGSLRAQISPFLRTPSSPALSSELSAETPNRESLAELWSNFLEQEAGSRPKPESGSGGPKP